MTMVPMPTGIKGIDNTPKLKESLVNMFHAGQYIIRTPGVGLVSAVGSSRARGSATWYVDGNAYFVIGGTLYQLDSSEAVNAIGNIDGTEDCEFSLGQVSLVIIVKGGSGYAYNSGTGLVRITSSNFLPSKSVDFIDGRHVYIPSDGSPAFYSEIDQAGNINALNFFDAEELPDLNQVTVNIKNNLYIGGSESFEIYRTTGQVSPAFSRRNGARIDVGYVSGIQRFKGSFFFIGRDRDQNFAIHAMADGGSQIISNDAINELLNSEYSQQELEDSNSYSYVWKGIQVVGWNLPRHSINFAAGNWFYSDSQLLTNDVHIWDNRSITFAHGRYYVGNRVSGNIGKLVQEPSEYGENVPYQLTTFVRSKRDSYLSIASLEIDALTGQAGTTVGLALSSDGRDYSDFMYRDLMSVGNYNNRVRWAGGLGTYESFCGIRLRGTGSVQYSLESIEVS